MQRKILEEIISKQSERKSLAYVINTKNGDEFIISRGEKTDYPELDNEIIEIEDGSEVQDLVQRAQDVLTAAETSPLQNVSSTDFQAGVGRIESSAPRPSDQLTPA